MQKTLKTLYLVSTGPVGQNCLLNLNCCTYKTYINLLLQNSKHLFHKLITSHKLFKFAHTSPNSLSTILRGHSPVPNSLHPMHIKTARNRVKATQRRFVLVLRGFNRANFLTLVFHTRSFINKGFCAH